MKSREAIDAILDAGGVPVLAHYPAAPEQPTLIKLITDWGVRGLEVYYRRFTPETVRADGGAGRRDGSLATGGSDYHGDTGCVRRGDADDLRAARRRPTGCSRRLRSAPRSSVRRPRREIELDDHAHAAGVRRPTSGVDARAARRLHDELAEFTTDDVALPRFHVWTLGCQMNHSDSEEMAGALAAAGCAEAPILSRPI